MNLEAISTFSRSNQINGNLINIRGISKNGKAYIKLTATNGREIFQKDFHMNENKAMKIMQENNTEKMLKMFNIKKKQIRNK